MVPLRIGGLTMGWNEGLTMTCRRGHVWHFTQGGQTCPTCRIQNRWLAGVSAALVFLALVAYFAYLVLLLV